MAESYKKYDETMTKKGVTTAYKYVKSPPNEVNRIIF